MHSHKFKERMVTLSIMFVAWIKQGIAEGGIPKTWTEYLMQSHCCSMRLTLQLNTQWYDQRVINCGKQPVHNLRVYGCGLPCNEPVKILLLIAIAMNQYTNESNNYL